MQYFEQGHAVLVGVGRSMYRPWSLPVTVRDAEALKAVLVDPARCGYRDDPQHVRLLTNEEATQANILGALEALAASTARDANATVVVYFSGHGLLQLEGDGHYYLIPHDTQAGELFASTALPAERFIEGLRSIRARRLLVILDTCYAEGMATAKSLPPRGFSTHGFPESLAEELGRGTGRAVFTSCRGTQSSWISPAHDLSVFTHHLVEGLRGEGSKAGETTVRVSSLMNLLSRAVPESARQLGREQTPFFKFEAEDFPVALIAGGKGLSVGGDPAPPPGISAKTRVGVVAGTVATIGAVDSGNANSDSGRQSVSASLDADRVEPGGRAITIGRLQTSGVRKGEGAERAASRTSTGQDEGGGSGELQGPKGDKGPTTETLSVERRGRDPRRYVNAWFEGEEPILPLLVGRRYPLSLQIGPRRVEAGATTAPFVEPKWGALQEMRLLVTLYSEDFTIEGRHHSFRMPRQGASEVFTSHVLARHAGSCRLLLVISLARELEVLQQLEIAVEAVEAPVAVTVAG